MTTIRVGRYELEPTAVSVDLYEIVTAGKKSKNPGQQYRVPVGYFAGYASAGRRLLELLQNESDATDMRALIAATESAKREIIEALQGARDGG
jgi:hypothetical protein